MITTTSKLFKRLSVAMSTCLYRYYGLQGGTSSSKTISDIQLACILASNDINPTLTSIVAESVPHLKRGAIRDFFNIMDISSKDVNWNSTDMIYTFPNGSKIEFFSADNASKLRGARRDRLILNECNNLTIQAYNQLEPRTKEWIIADWNPEVKFWWHDKVKDLKNAWFDISTHWDNPFLDDRIRNSIESRRDIDPEWYRVYGLGLIGQYEGLVFRNTRVADLNIEDYQQLYYGLDFGYMPDPFAFVVAAKVGDVIYVLKEVVAVGLENPQIAELIKPHCNNSPVFCDSAEPKSIRELKSNGVRGARGVKKGADSKRYRINWAKGFEIVIDKSCKNLIKEIESYSRMKDKNGELLPLFQDGNDHSIDALTYAFNAVMFQGLNTVKGSKSSLY